MASPSGKGARAQEAPGCGPRSLARDLVDSVDDAEGLYVAVERCPLCNTTRRRLTCAKCVQNGDFVYFDGRDRERYGGRHGPILLFFPRCLLPLGRWSLAPEARVQTPESRSGGEDRELLCSQGTGSGPDEGRFPFPPIPPERSLTPLCFWVLGKMDRWCLWRSLPLLLLWSWFSARRCTPIQILV